MSDTSAPGSVRATFGKLCKQVCDEQGWELLPSGVNVQCPDDRHQVVSLEFFESDTDELVRLYTIIGNATQLPPLRLETAMRLNFNLPHGALAISGDDLVMVDTLMLRDSDAAEIRASLRYLAEQADYYERTMYGTDDH